ncbi:MAG: sodium:solute symporter family protein, partial [Candidatus Hydrogenedentes bacterium]|nr:sodium:solute symporter family protein [Candidatus Hydrogenedentota bacterium]
IYDDGMAAGRTDPFGYALCILILGLFFAARLWRKQLTTLGDLFRMRYGAAVEKVAVILVVPGSVLWAAAQVRAFGQVLSATSDFSTDLTIFIAALVVISYTVMGGLLADAITDFIQGIALFIGLSILGIAVWWSLPPDFSAAAALTPERLELGGHDRSFLVTLEAWAVPVIGSLFSQELIARTLAARSPQVAQRACFIACGIYIVVGLIPATLGLFGPALLPGLEDGEQLLPALAQAYLPTLFYIVFAGALISAILSTVDSALLAGAALVSHNLIVPMLRMPSEQAKVRTARIVVVIFGVLAYVLATNAHSVLGLVEEASAFGTAGMFTAAVFAFFPGWGGKHSAMAALLAGVGAWILFHYILETETPYVYSLIAAILAFLLVMLAERTWPEPVRSLDVCPTEE